MKKRLLRFASCALIIMMSMGLLMPVGATSITDLEDEVKKNQDNLNSITGNIATLEDEKDVLEEEIHDLDAELINTMTSIGILEDNILEKEGQIVIAQGEYDAAKATEETQYEAMKIRIKYMYESGNSSYLAAFLEAKSMSDILNKADYFEKLYAYDRKMLEEFHAITVQVEEMRVALETEKASLEAEKVQMVEQQAYLDTLLVKKKAQSADFEVQIAKARQEAATYKAKIKEDEKKISKLKDEERKKLAQQAANKTPSNSNSNTSTVITNATGSELGKQIANYASQYVGYPYVSGGTSLTNGADCSGFTYRVYADFGYGISRTSYSQRNNGTAVDYASAQPGDIICYEGHVGIYIGGGYIVHASTPQSGIKISNAQYRPIIGVRRII